MIDLISLLGGKNPLLQRIKKNTHGEFFNELQ